MDLLTTFADSREFERAVALLEAQSIEYTTVSPEPAYCRVGVTAIVLDEAARSRFMSAGGDVMCCGWVDYRPPRDPVGGREPRTFDEDVVGAVVIVMLAPCVADLDRLRLIAHVGGDLSEVLPLLNAEMPAASYVRGLPVLTSMDGHRMVSIFKDRVAIAKADDIVDAWVSLERVRCLLNDTWSRRASITPSYELRQRPPAIEIYKRLPGTNCRECGEATCLAFAFRVWKGELAPALCHPVFGGDRGDLRPALAQICSGLGLSDDDTGSLGNRLGRSS